MVSSYIPLYRKYRPQKFSEVVGQETVVKTLSNSIELNKVAHAYLLTGPRGTGKTSTARIFAKSLNCEKGPTLEPCGTCPSCTDIANGNAIDVIEIDAASNRKVEDARNLLEKVQFVPVAGKYKIYIIDEVHMLTTEAFNTLLKTLEEPPKNLVFILATTEPHKVLNTIISRCQRFDFRRIKQDLIIERLRKIADVEGLKIANQALSLIARKSAGGMRDALGLLDQASVLGLINKEVTEKDILNLLGSMPEDTLSKLADILANKDAQNLISVLNEIIALGSEPVQVIRELIGYFRNLMLIKTTDEIEKVSSLIDASEQFYTKLKDQSEKFEVIEIAQIIEKLSEYERVLKNTSNQYLWLEIALISICYRQDIQVIKDLEKRVSKLEELLSNNKTTMKPVPATFSVPQELIKPAVEKKIEKQFAEPVPQKADTIQTQQENIPKIERTEAVKAEITSETARKTEETISNEASTISHLSGDVNKDWSTLLENVDSIPSRTLFMGLAKPVEINSEKVVITFNVESFVKQAQEKSKISPLEKAAEKLFGKTPKILIRTPLPEDERIRNASATQIQQITQPIKPEAKPAPVKKQNFEQISQELEEVRTAPAPKVVIAEEHVEGSDEDVFEYVDNDVAPVDLSDGAKMVLDLFQGKIIEQ